MTWQFDEFAEPPEILYDFVGAGGLAYDLVLTVERLPLADEKYPAELVGKLPGGFIANATCAAARLGLRTAYIGWVGEDSEGDLLRDDFLEWNVHPAGLECVLGEPTPFTIVVTDQKGRRAILLPPSPLYSALLSYDQLQVAARSRVIYTFPRDLVWCGQLRGAAVEAGGLFVLDVEQSIPMRGEQLLNAIQMADIVFVTRKSLAMLGVRSITRLVAQRQWVIMTAGSRGAYGIVYGQRRPVFQPAREVVPVDTTGAGDCFHAALIAARLDGATLPEALAFATAAASIKVQHRGARGGLPTRAEVEALL
jgi:sugar/nucleoside kinase (ribokinase family)